MTIEQIIEAVTEICRKHRVSHLSLFGSYVKGTQTQYSDLDFIVHGVEDFELLKEEIDEIPTLMKIDLFEYEQCKNEFLREDMKKYGRKIF